MANYANQLTIVLDIDKTVRQAGDKSGDQFAPWVFWKYKKAAMKKLTGNGYKLWEYLYSWAGAKKFDFSPKAITNETGISDKGVRLARKELEEFGCLTPVENTTNQFQFVPSAIL